MTISSRERVLSIFAHEVPDREPRWWRRVRRPRRVLHAVYRVTQGRGLANGVHERYEALSGRGEQMAHYLQHEQLDV